LLLPPNPFPDRTDDVYSEYEADRRPGPFPHLLLLLDYPSQCDKAIVYPVELEQDGQEHCHWGMDEEAVKWSAKCCGVIEEADVDGYAEARSSAHDTRREDVRWDRVREGHTR